jgi:hypothetical protein
MLASGRGKAIIDATSYRFPWAPAGQKRCASSDTQIGEMLLFYLDSPLSLQYVQQGSLPIGGTRLVFLIYLLLR